MKKEIQFLFLTLFAFFISIISSAQIDTANWYPLEVGNKWQFSYGIEPVYYYSREVIGDTVMPNGKTYAIVKDGPNIHYQRNHNNQFVYTYNNSDSSEFLLYDFISADGTFWERPFEMYYWGIYKTEFEFNYDLERHTYSKFYDWVDIDSSNNSIDTVWGAFIDVWPIKVTQGLGVSNNLNGAIINGIRYGTMVDIKESSDFYPLHIGNKWYYEVVELENYEPPYNFIVTDTFSVEVLSDTLMPNGIIYAELSKEFGPGKYVRADSNGIYYYNDFDSSDALIFDLFAEVNEEYNVHHFDLLVAELYMRETRNIFEDSVLTYLYDVDGFITYGITFAEKYGPIQQSNGSVPSYWNLIGCLIDGQHYGYSPLVGVEQSKSSELKNEMTLFQNYPNPFNPSTIIKYFIPKNEKRETIKVKLVIYDILGKEVSVLVNENQKPGNYEVEFYPYAQGLNLSSGIYYYRIMTDTYSKTRKMILIK